MHIYLSKSDYKIAKSCPTKLYYKKLGYPQTSEEDYGFSISNLIITKIAELLFTDGKSINLSGDLEKNDLPTEITKTIAALKNENITIFKPLIYCNYKLSKPDILRKRGNQFQLVCVKQRSINPKQRIPIRNRRDGKISSVWKSYIEDVTFQVIVLKELLAHLYGEQTFNISSYLALPIHNRVTNSCRGSNFLISKQGDYSYDVSYLGDINELKKDHILHFLNVNAEVSELKARVSRNINLFLESMIGQMKKIPTPIGKNCKNCEFRISDLQSSLNGFRECWGDDRANHIIDLYQVGKISESNNFLVDDLIRAGKFSMDDITEAALDHTSFRERQIIQIKYTRNNQEWCSDELAKILDSFIYPLHFIDFETCRLDISYDGKINPHEQYAFEWSCHSIHRPSVVLEELVASFRHSEFIDLSGDFPNFKFAETLRSKVGDRGTILVWGTHEKSVLKDIYRQIETFNYPSSDLKSWLGLLISESVNNFRFVDMHQLTLKHYFHPLMKAKTSLKSVLPAIWTTNSYLHQIPWLAKYFLVDVNGQVLSPYATLKGVEINQKTRVIKDGGGAMIAYQEALYSHKDNIEQMQQLLKQYCELDTLAMVIIWLHWQHVLGAGKW